MSADTKESMIRYIEENMQGQLSYEVLGELAVVYASQMDSAYK